MSRMGKIKGANGEREILNWFMDNFDLPELKRNLEQTRNGGADCLDIPGIALEVKRQEALTVPAWWEQTKRQAIIAKRFPVLAYRQNRKKWHFCLPASLITPHSWGYLQLNESEFKSWFQARLNNDTS